MPFEAVLVEAGRDARQACLAGVFQECTCDLRHLGGMSQTQHTGPYSGEQRGRDQ